MAVSLIPDLEDVIRHGTRAKRVDALQRITALFLDGAKGYSDAHVDLFDDVFGLLIEEIETKARAELSRHLAPVGNAPVKVLRTLANDDDIAVAGPVLKYAPRLAETDLVGVAKTKSQAHLQAISARPALGEAVTGVLVRRGDREVARCVADNRGARISQDSFVSLVRRAEDDGILAEKVGLRPDIPEPMFRELLIKATAVVRNRLLVAATASGKAEIHRVLAKVSKEVGARATLAKVPVNVVDRLLGGAGPDPVLILCRAIGLNWPTVKAIILLRPDAKSASNQGLESAFANYERLSNS